MPTIDLRGQPGGTAGTAKKTLEQKAAEATEKQRLQREKIGRNQDIRYFSKVENERIRNEDRASKARISASLKAQKERDAKATKEQNSRLRAEQAESKKESKLSESALKAKLRTEQAEVRKQTKISESSLRTRLKEEAKQETELFRARWSAAKAEDSARTRAIKLQDKKAFGIFPGLQRNTLAILKAQNAPPAGGGGSGGGGGAKGGGFWLGGYKGFDGNKFSEGFSPSVIGGMVGTMAKVVAGVIAAAIEAPLLPGQAIRGALAISKPGIDFNREAYGISRANQFSKDKFGNYLSPGTGTTAGTQTLSLLNSDPAKIMASLNSYGMGLRSPEDAARTGVNFARQSLSPGFTGMPDGTVESVARQRAGYQGTIAGGGNQYLTAISGTLEDAFVKGLDRAKVLDSIESAIDQMARGGAGGISTNAILNMIARFQASGTPGGRTGESAVSAMAGMSGFLKNTSGSPGGQMMNYSQMSKYGMLKTEANIKDYVGADNWNAMSPKVRSLVVRDATAAAKAGNTFAAMQIVNETMMGSNPGRIADVVKPALSKAVPPYLVNKALSSIGLTTMQGYENEAGAGAKTPGAPRSQSKDFVMSDEYYRQILMGNKYSVNDANRLIAEGKKTNTNPLSLANTPAQWYNGNAGSQQVVVGKPSAEDVQTANSNMVIRAQTTPGLGQAQNAAAQADIRGGSFEMNTVLPLAVAGAAMAFDSVAKKVDEFGDRLSKAMGWMDKPGTDRFRDAAGAGSPYVSPPPAMNPNHQ